MEDGPGRPCVPHLPHLPHLPQELWTAVFCAARPVVCRAPSERIYGLDEAPRPILGLADLRALRAACVLPPASGPMPDGSPEPDGPSGRALVAALDHARPEVQAAAGQRAAWALQGPQWMNDDNMAQRRQLLSTARVLTLVPRPLGARDVEAWPHQAAVRCLRIGRPAELQLALLPRPSGSAPLRINMLPPELFGLVVCRTPRVLRHAAGLQQLRHFTIDSPHEYAYRLVPHLPALESLTLGFGPDLVGLTPGRARMLGAALAEALAAPSRPVVHLELALSNTLLAGDFPLAQLLALPAGVVRTCSLRVVGTWVRLAPSEHVGLALLWAAPALRGLERLHIATRTAQRPGTCGMLLPLHGATQLQALSWTHEGRLQPRMASPALELQPRDWAPLLALVRASPGLRRLELPDPGQRGVACSRGRIRMLEQIVAAVPRPLGPAGSGQGGPPQQPAPLLRICVTVVRRDDATMNFGRALEGAPLRRAIQAARLTGLRTALAQSRPDIELQAHVRLNGVRPQGASAVHGGGQRCANGPIL